MILRRRRAVAYGKSSAHAIAVIFRVCGQGGARPQGSESKQPLELKFTLTQAAIYRMVTALALAVCALVLFVVQEQSRTIEAQRLLIHVLFQDSLQLNALKQKHAPLPERS